jgi:hypothetical protein
MKDITSVAFIPKKIWEVWMKSTNNPADELYSEGWARMRQKQREREERCNSERENGIPHELEMEVDPDPLDRGWAAVWRDLREQYASWREEEEENRRTRAKGIFMLVFLSSLGFCVGAIGGSIIVKQILKDYNTCVLIS